MRERCEAEHKRQKSIYDEKVHGKPLTVVINVAVLTIAVLPGGKSRKFHHLWKGPFKVVERVAGCTYKIKCIKGTKTQCVRFDRLKPAVATSNPVRKDLVAVPTPISTKTAGPDTVPLEWADETWPEMEDMSEYIRL